MTDEPRPDNRKSGYRKHDRQAQEQHSAAANECAGAIELAESCRISACLVYELSERFTKEQPTLRRVGGFPEPEHGAGRILDETERSHPGDWRDVADHGAAERPRLRSMPPDC